MHGLSVGVMIVHIIYPFSHQQVPLGTYILYSVMSIIGIIWRHLSSTVDNYLYFDSNNSIILTSSAMANTANSKRVGDRTLFSM